MLQGVVELLQTAMRAVVADVDDDDDDSTMMNGTMKQSATDDDQPSKKLDFCRTQETKLSIF